MTYILLTQKDAASNLGRFKRNAKCPREKDPAQMRDRRRELEPGPVAVLERTTTTKTTMCRRDIQVALGITPKWDRELQFIVYEGYHRYMAMLEMGPRQLNEEATAIYSHLFQALGEPARLAVLQHLAWGEHRVRDLVEHVELAQSTVSKHLSFLLECRLVVVRPDGRSSWYSLSEPAAISGLIAAAEGLLDATGTKAELCVHLREPGHTNDNGMEMD